MKHRAPESAKNDFGVIDKLLREGNTFEAVSMLQQLVEEGKSREDREAQALALYRLCQTLASAGDTRGALARLRELTAIVKKEPVSPELVVKALVLSGQLHFEEFELAAARTALEESLSLLQSTELADRCKLQVTARLYLGRVNQAEDRLQEAVELYGSCFRFFDVDDQPREAAEVLQSMALARAVEGVFDEAEELIDRSIRLLRGVSDTRGMALGYSQLGALLVRQAKLHRAIEAYQQSLALYEDVEDASARRRILINLGAIHNMIAASDGKLPEKGFDYFQQARLVGAERRPDGISHRELRALHYLVDEEFERNILTKRTVRFSRNFEDSMRNLARGILAASWEGDLVEERRLRPLRGKLIFNFGTKTGDRSLVKFALSDFIWSGEIKAIQGVFSKHQVFEGQDEVCDYLDWLLGSYWTTRQQVAVTTVLGWLSPYCPDRYLDRVFTHLIKLADEPFNFFANYDLKRPALKALGRYGDIFKRTQRIKLVEKLLRLLPGEDFRVAEEILGALMGIRYRDLPARTKLSAIDVLSTMAETDYRDIPKLYSALTILALESGREARNKAAKFLLSQFDQDRHRTPVAVYMSWMADRLTKERTQTLAGLLTELLDEESRTARPGRVELGTLNLPIALSNYLPSTQNSMRDRIMDTLLRYIVNRNIAIFRRVDAIEGLIKHAKALSDDDKTRAESVLLNIALASPEPALQPVSLTGRFDTLQGLACLALTHFRSRKFKSLSSVVLRLSAVADDDARYHVVRAMAEMAQYFPETRRRQMLIALYEKTFDKAHSVRREAITGLAKMPRVLQTDVGREVWARIREMKRDHHPWVRTRVAFALEQIFSQLDESERLDAQEALSGLTNDVHVWVRKAARRSLRSVKKGRGTDTKT